MKTKMRRRLQRVMLYAFVFLFASSVLLFYLPVTQPSTPPPVKDIQNPQGTSQQIPPEVQRQLNQQAGQGAPASVNANPAAQPNPPAAGAAAAPAGTQPQGNPFQGALAQ